ncbi:MAG: hypothetical protein V9G15_01085 [Dermatophilaceae bacterium]
MTDVELVEVSDFLRGEPPFADLPANTLASLPAKLKVQYFRRGSVIIAAGKDNSSLYVVRSGAVELIDTSGEFMDRVEVGGNLWVPQPLEWPRPRPTRPPHLEDTLASSSCQGATFHELNAGHPSFEEFFDMQRASRMRGAVASLHTSAMGGAILKTRVRARSSPGPAVTAPHDSDRCARQRRSCPTRRRLVPAHRRGLATIVGIITDRDLRSDGSSQSARTHRPPGQDAS